MPESARLRAHAMTPDPAAGVPDRHPALAGHIGDLALDALARELMLCPKPGLVTPIDPGSHTDMDVWTFRRSLQALRDYFPDIARCGLAGADFTALQAKGLAAERAMLAATGGINTHRGAIFNLGLLCASAAADASDARPLIAADVCEGVARRWGAAILAAGRDAPAASHGRRMAQAHGCGGARAEAAAGFPTVRAFGLPAYLRVRAGGGTDGEAAVEALFALMAELDDTNLLWRGGPDGLRLVKRLASTFLASGGVTAPDWAAHAQRIGRDLVARRLSPGGSADLLGVTLFLGAL